MFIGMFILCKNGKYSVWFEVKCSLDYYVLHIRQPRKCYYFRHECASEMRLRCFFMVKGLLIFLPPRLSKRLIVLSSRQITIQRKNIRGNNYVMHWRDLYSVDSG